MKLIICPLTVYISDILFKGVFYSTIYQPIVVGLILAVSAHMMEVLMLKRDTQWMSLALDFVAATAIVYFSQFFLRGSVVSLNGALLTAFLLGITEYFQHMWLISTGKTKKTE